jgi:outer membrane protein W
MKIVLVVILLVFFCLPLAAEAASIGSPELQGEQKITGALEWSYVISRDLEFKNATGGSSADIQLRDYKIDHGYNAAAKIIYGALRGVDVYAKIGISDYEIKGDTYSGGVKSTSDKLSMNNSFLGGVGVKMAYEHENGWIFGVDLQYSTSKHKANLNATNTSGSESSTSYKDARMHEWHIAPYAATKYFDFTPYIGVRYSQALIKIKGPNNSSAFEDMKLDADDNFGIFIGTDYRIGDRFKLNLEGRFLDETAITLGASYILN